MAGIHRGIHQAEADLAEISRQQLAILQAVSDATREEFDAGAIQRYYHYERHLAHLAVERDADLADLRRRERVKRAELEEAMKRRKMVEKLEEYHAEAVQLELRDLDQKHSDEVAGNRARIASRWL